jgi:hypothetical protein
MDKKYPKVIQETSQVDKKETWIISIQAALPIFNAFFLHVGNSIQVVYRR